MAKPLVIVESPAKARTIAGFLGADFAVESSVGHVRDLEPKGLGIDVDHGFKPTYVVHANKREVLKRLRAALRTADELYLATDEDREGEAISWHLLQELKPDVPVKRMVFHEITRTAIEHAVDNWREIDYGLVDAQETRRIVDRLFGYPVSEVLWRKVNRGLSAGRVQSPAVRLVVDRERERIAFVSAGYWDLDAAFPTAPRFTARLVGLEGRKVASGRDFDATGRAGDNVTVLDEPAARQLAGSLDGAAYSVRSVEEKPFRSSPKPPFMTSTLQQEGGRKLRMSSAQVMRVAQGLYERGYITYMRTDSTNLSEIALGAARSQVRELYGDEYVPDVPRTYARKVKNAQEAHEAIRPAGDSFRTPDSVSGELRTDEMRLYDLIWKRTVASQMTDARGLSVSVRLAATAADGRDTEWAASGRTITFPGYLRAYVEGADDPEAELDDRETLLPALAEGDALPTPDLEVNGHSTSPPARFTEASLVKRLEELGIGRPSTYASIMQTIQDRGYVWKKGTALVPTWTAFAVVRLLEQHFTDLVDYAFTARMEDELDEIATHKVATEPWLSAFWFGNGTPGLKSLVDAGIGKIDAADINTMVVGADESGEVIVVKPGRYGPYVKRGEDTASVPDDLPPDELTVAKALELLSAPSGDRLIGVDPDSGLEVFVKAGRYGPYVQLGELVEGGKEKPRTASLFKTMSPEDVTLDDALRLLSLPRTVGVDPADGVEITAQNGRYGPYIKKGTDSRSLESEEQLFTITLERALEIFAEPKRRRGQTASAPLREVGVDPVSEKPVVLKEGRFGPYVTDGDTNASLRKGDDPESITIERAAELLQIRREAGPAKKSSARKRGRPQGDRPRRRRRARPRQEGAAKKAAAKKATAKQAAGRRRPKAPPANSTPKRGCVERVSGDADELDATRPSAGGYCVEIEGVAQRAPVPPSVGPVSGRFIVFEGGEASGKTTQARRLADRLGAVLTREPAAPCIGARLRDCCSTPSIVGLDVRTEALLMAADRAQHVAEVIAPALAAGGDVVADRYVGSSLAYQGHGRGPRPRRGPGPVDVRRRTPCRPTWSFCSTSTRTSRPPAVRRAPIASRAPGPPSISGCGPATSRWPTPSLIGGSSSTAMVRSTRWPARSPRWSTNGSAGSAGDLGRPDRRRHRPVRRRRRAGRCRRLPAGGPVRAGARLPVPRAARQREAGGARAFAAGLLAAGSRRRRRPPPRRAGARRAAPRPRGRGARGAAIRVEQATEIIRRASRSPIEGHRKVLVLDEFHLVGLGPVAPMLLKTIEEPPATARSSWCWPTRCRPSSSPSPRGASASTSGRSPSPSSPTPSSPKGWPPSTAPQIAAFAEGDLRRARLLATDDHLGTRLALWRAVPGRLDGRGTTAATLVDELRANIDDAEAPLRAQQDAEVVELNDRIERYGQPRFGGPPARRASPPQAAAHPH